MLSHIMVGSNDIARSRNSTMLCLSQWALAGCRGRKWPATLHAQWRAFPPSMASRRLLIPMAARSTSQWLALHRPTHGTKPASRMAVPRSRTRLVCAGEPPARHISLIFAIPMATNCAPFIASQLPEYSPFKLRRAALFGRSSRAKELCGARFGLSRGSDRAVLATTGVRHFASAIVYPIAQPNRATLQHLAALQLDGANRRCNAGILVARVEDARRASRSIDGGTDRKADLVDQAGP